MTKQKQKVIDCRSYGPVIDAEGCMSECFDNLEFLLIYLYDKYPKILRGQKCRVLKSRVGYEGKHENPFRYETAIIKTVGQLLKDYSQWRVKGRPAGQFDLEDAREKRNWQMEAMHKEGQRRAAWGMYTQQVNYARAVEREQEYDKELRSAQSDTEKDQILKRKKQEEANSGSLMYIG